MISMADSIHTFLVLAGAAFSLMVCAGAITFGVASVSRWMNWAPINTTINIHNYREATLDPADGGKP